MSTGFSTRKAVKNVEKPGNFPVCKKISTALLKTVEIFKVDRISPLILELSGENPVEASLGALGQSLYLQQAIFIHLIIQIKQVPL